MRIGFYFAYPKRAQKLLVDRSQTLLIYFIFCFDNVCLCYSTQYNFRFLFVVRCGISTEPSIIESSEKRKQNSATFFHTFTKVFHNRTTFLPCLSRVDTFPHPPSCDRPSRSPFLSYIFISSIHANEIISACRPGRFSGVFCTPALHILAQIIYFVKHFARFSDYHFDVLAIIALFQNYMS